MKVAGTIDEIRSAVAEARRTGSRTVGRVPTMGALHEGHYSLIDAAREGCDFVVVSIFVNPAQFAPGEDLDSYPRDLDADLEACGARGADLVFAPGVVDPALRIVHALAEIFLDAVVTLSARRGDVVRIDRGVGIRGGQLRVGSVAVAARGRDHESALEQSFAVDAHFVALDDVCALTLNASSGDFTFPVTRRAQLGDVPGIRR